MMQREQVIDSFRRCVPNQPWRCKDCAYDQYPPDRCRRLLKADVIALMKHKPLVGRWKQIDVGMSPGGTPGFVCSLCGGTEHLHGAEFPKRPPYCIECGAINFYPWEKLYEVPEHEE